MVREPLVKQCAELAPVRGRRACVLGHPQQRLHRIRVVADAVEGVVAHSGHEGISVIHNTGQGARDVVGAPQRRHDERLVERRRERAARGRRVRRSSAAVGSAFRGSSIIRRLT